MIGSLVEQRRVYLSGREIDEARFVEYVERHVSALFRPEMHGTPPPVVRGGC